MPTDTETYEAIALLVALSGVTVPTSAPADGLRLCSDSIGHKFGFNDGDAPATVEDLVEAWFGKYHYIGSTVWHPVLMDLVRTRLLPALGNPEMDLYLLDTSHNPIRTTHPLPDDFPHGEVYVPWLEVLARVVTHMESGDTNG